MDDQSTVRKRVLVLGASGMLGSMVTEVLSNTPGLAVTGTVRHAKIRAVLTHLPRIRAEGFEVEEALDKPGDLTELIHSYDWVINCIGVIKPRIAQGIIDSELQAIQVNSVFPRLLAMSAARTDTMVIQIATDCVFSGQTPYVHNDERALHDAADVYGRSKSLGEVESRQVWLLRTSVIGPEIENFQSLWSWFQRMDGPVDGYETHYWNGMTSYAFAKICRGLIFHEYQLPTKVHLAPADYVNKASLLRLLNNAWKRSGVRVRSSYPAHVDRRLETCWPETVRMLWQWAGYQHPPQIKDLIEEAVAYKPSWSLPACAS